MLHAPAGRLHVFPGADDAPGLAERLGRAGLTLLEAAGLAAPAPFLPPQAALLELRARIRTALDPAGALGLGPAWEREA